MTHPLKIGLRVWIIHKCLLFVFTFGIIPLQVNTQLWSNPISHCLMLCLILKWVILYESSHVYVTSSIFKQKIDGRDFGSEVPKVKIDDSFQWLIKVTAENEHWNRKKEHFWQKLPKSIHANGATKIFGRKIQSKNSKKLLIFTWNGEHKKILSQSTVYGKK